MTKTTWTPICTDELATAMRGALLDIAGALRVHRFTDATLSGAGMAAVLFGYLERALPECGFGAESERLLDGACERLGSQVVDESLFAGFTGLAWCVEHLAPAGDDEDDPNQAIDEALLDALARRQRPWHFDLVGGLVGLGVYALERAQRPPVTRARPTAPASAGRVPLALACAELVIDRLAQQAERRDGGFAWRTRPERKAHDIGPERFDLGLAHGTPGVVGFLARACRWPQLAPRARPLLDGAVAWLLSRPRVDGPLRYAAHDGERRSTRAAWCYGDPGVAVALLAAARAAGRDDWEAAAWQLALDCTALGPDDAGVTDASLCHGSAGLAHLFRRFFHAGGDPRFADAARRWFGHTLALRRPDVGLGGFTCATVAADGTVGAAPGADLLTGSVGIALALLAGVSDVEPAWDRALLCALPPR